MYTLISDHEGLEAALQVLEEAPVIALDTEASSFHRYKERVCLIQLSDRERTFLVDPFTIEHPQRLGALFENKALETVIHDADYDLRLIKRSFGFRVHHVFDTLIAAELLNEPELSLASLLKKYANVQLDKKFQKADWSKRPLPQDMLAYAAMDTAHLIGLQDILKEQLIAKGRWSWAQEEFTFLTEHPFLPIADPEPGFLRLKGAKRLKPHELAILRELHAWRETMAERLDRAPFMVLGNDVLLALSTDPPKDVQDLAQRKGVGDRTMQRNGEAIMHAVRIGLDTPKEDRPKLPKPKRYPRDEAYEDRMKRLKKERDEQAAALDLQPGVLCPNQVLATIARETPDGKEELAALPGFRHWQVETIGQALLDQIHVG